MSDQIDPLVQDWLDQCKIYYKNIGIADEKLDEAINFKGSYMMNLWDKMQCNEITKIYRSFEHMITTETDSLKRFNEYYTRFGYIKEPEVKNSGGRYWL